MGKHELNRCDYGARYGQTSTVADLGILAERILFDLLSAGADGIPAGSQFGIHVEGNILLQLYVGGLKDEFTFVEPATRRYSDQANVLADHLTQIVESYDWINPDDPTERRFFCSVYLLAELDCRSAFWEPGVVHVF